MEIEEEVGVEETEDADKEEEVKEEEEEVEETGIKAISAVKDQGTKSVASLMHWQNMMTLKSEVWKKQGV